MIEAGDMFAITAPVRTETLYGISVTPRGAQNRQVWAELEQQLVWYVPEATGAREAADLQIRLRRQGRQLATVDARIAVTALRYDLTLLTTDNDVEAVPSLHHENWR